MGEGSCRIGLIPIYIFQCNSFLYQTYNSIFFREKNEHENAGSVVQVPGSNRKRRRPKIVGVRVNLPPPPCILGTIKHRMTKILTTHRGGGFCSPPPHISGTITQEVALLYLKPFRLQIKKTLGAGGGGRVN